MIRPGRMMAALLLVALGSMTCARAATPVAGRDYIDISPVQSAANPSQVVVTEFFSYQCPHCAAFAPHFSAWAKTLPAGVKVERVPISLGRQSWEPAARTYLALQAMNLVAGVDDALFAAIHQKGLRLQSEADFAGWLSAKGVDGTTFSNTYRSFGVDSQMRVAEARARDARVPSIPALMIDGRYLVAIEDDGVGRRFREQLGFATELVARALRQREAAAPEDRH